MCSPNLACEVSTSQAEHLGPRFSLTDYELQRDPDESDEDFTFHLSLFR